MFSGARTAPADASTPFASPAGADPDALPGDAAPSGGALPFAFSAYETPSRAAPPCASGVSLFRSRGDSFFSRALAACLSAAIFFTSPSSVSDGASAHLPFPGKGGTGAFAVAAGWEDPAAARSSSADLRFRCPSGSGGGAAFALASARARASSSSFCRAIANS